jgi:hypothetical protein
MKNPNSEYFATKLTIEDTGVYESDFLERKRGEGMPEDFIQQEYFCSFTRGAEGAYYGKLIQKARDEDRITRISVTSDLPVHTAWDIGIGDSSAIWLFQTLKNGRINFLHYYENNNEPLDHYLRYLDNWKAKHGVVFGKHFVPHDMRNREFTSGISRMEVARNMGYVMTPIVNPEGRAYGIEEGIQTARSLLPHCQFDESHCKRGVQCLDFYRKKWNDILKVYFDEPLHDQYSHGADAFRMAAIGIKTIGTSIDNGLTAEKILDMRKRNYGY